MDPDIIAEAKNGQLKIRSLHQTLDKVNFCLMQSYEQLTLNIRDNTKQLGNKGDPIRENNKNGPQLKNPSSQHSPQQGSQLSFNKNIIITRSNGEHNEQLRQYQEKQQSDQEHQSISQQQQLRQSHLMCVQQKGGIQLSPNLKIKAKNGQQNNNMKKQQSKPSMDEEMKERKTKDQGERRQSGLISQPAQQQLISVQALTDDEGSNLKSQIDTILSYPLGQECPLKYPYKENLFATRRKESQFDHNIYNEEEEKESKT